MHKYKKLFFQTSTRNYLFGNFFFLLIIRNYKFFLGNYKKFLCGPSDRFFQTDPEIIFLEKYEKFFLKLKKNFWVGICLVGWPRSVYIRLLFTSYLMYFHYLVLDWIHCRQTLSVSMWLRSCYSGLLVLMIFFTGVRDQVF